MGDIDPVTDDTMMAGADQLARRWTAPASGAIRPGSERHKTAFCRLLLDTHNPYKPAVIAWPRLDSEARDRLVALPIWDIAVQTEGKAKIRVLSYAETIADPLLREAVALNGFESAFLPWPERQALLAQVAPEIVALRSAPA